MADRPGRNYSVPTPYEVRVHISDGSVEIVNAKGAHIAWVATGATETDIDTASLMSRAPMLAHTMERIAWEMYHLSGLIGELHEHCRPRVNNPWHTSRSIPMPPPAAGKRNDNSRS